MKIEIFEIDFGSTGDLYMVTKRGNQIIIPDGETLFEKWCDKNDLYQIDVEPEFNADDTDHSILRIYDRNNTDLLKEFAMANRNKWQIEYDHDGEYYGDAAEFIDAAYATNGFA